MTCGIAVKRPLDYESYLNPESSIEAKRARQANPQCSPFRPQLGTLATSLMQSTNGPSFLRDRQIHNQKDSELNSLFSSVSNKCQLSGNQLESYLRAEVQYLKRRKLIPRRNFTDSNDTVDSTEKIVPNDGNKAYRGATSPASTNSGSDSDGEINNLINENQPNTSNNPIDSRTHLNDIYEKPHFSLRQVKLICERLLKEQELRIRYEYETLLIKKLEEKHDQFVQFSKEQLETRCSSSELSYLS